VARVLTRFYTLRFYLWRHLNTEVYKHRPQTLKALKDAIHQEVATIPPEMTKIMMENFRERLGGASRITAVNWVIMFFKN
jgi:actin-like ATPase involved in cell morphogenesis